MPKPYFYDKNKIKEILMVNHAGEFGAQSIYRGQLAFTKDSDDRNIIRHMLQQELEHLKYFENEIKEGKSRPTLLLPIWDIFGYMMGAVSVIAGPRTSMLLTESVEEVIVEHYQEQIDYLSVGGGDSELLSKIKQFKQEEAEHMEIAVNNDSKNAAFYNTTSRLIKKMCHVAIYLSKKI